MESLPYLDELTGRKSLPGKANNLEEARNTMQSEFKQAKKEAKDKRLSKFGGWIDGPKMKATGRFRTQKVNEKWWLIDPDGYLFFSVGPCLTGNRAETLAIPKRTNTPFFKYIPGEKDYLKWTGLRKTGGRQYVNFPALNYRRYFGEKWEETVNQGTHDRFRAWGLNTLACWSDEKLQKDKNPIHINLFHLWQSRDTENFLPSRFSIRLGKKPKKTGMGKKRSFLSGNFHG